MPPPITPAPSTPTRVTGRGRTAGSATPVSFLTSSVRKKIRRRFFWTSPPKTSPMWRASASSPVATGAPKPSSMTSSASSGAG
jgi:hypothetical protein